MSSPAPGTPRPRGAGWSRRHLLGLLAAGVGTLGACSALPTSGEVFTGGVISDDDAQLVQTAEGPIRGAGPEVIVQGFLRACAAGFSDGFATARSFLFPTLSETWNPTEAVRVYAGSTAPTVKQGPNGAVNVAAELLGVLDSTRVFTAQPDPNYSESLSLATTSQGQWRIVALPMGVLLSSSSLAASFADCFLFFLSSDCTRLVPELRWFPRRRLLVSLVEALLKGPSPWLAAGVISAVPEGTALVGDGVKVDGSTATVLLSAQAASASPRVQALLVDQIKGTLLQVGGVAEVVVTADSAPMESSAGLIASTAPSAGSLVGIAGGEVVQGVEEPRSVLVNADVLEGLEPRHPALGPDRTVYLVSGERLMRISADASEVAEAAVLGPGAVLPPVVDRHGWVWTGAAGALSVLNAQGARAELDAAWLSGAEVLDLDLSCESERLAVRYTKEGRTHVGVAAVRRNERGQPVGLGEPLALDVAAGWGLAWQDPVALVALEEGTDGVSMVRRTLVGGTSSITAGVAGAGRVVADRVGGDILLSDGAGQVWQRAGATWRSLGADVSDLAYSLS